MRRSSLMALVTASAVMVGLAGGTANAARSSAIPAGLHVQSFSWVSPEHGWLLGTAPCSQGTCTTVVGTRDGGGTWKELGTMDAPITNEQATGVTEVRFADDLHGWAFDPSAWATVDGGVTWTKQTPPGGRPVIALAADADVVYAVVSACAFGIPIGNCQHPTTLWRTAPDQGTWTQASITLPVTNLAVLALHGQVAYVAVPAALIAPAGFVPGSTLEVTVDGQTWSSRPDPCSISQGEYLSGVAPVSDTRVALLCQEDIGFGKAEKRVFLSEDNGQTTISAGKLPILGIVSQIAAAPNGTLVVSSFSKGSWIYRNGGDRTWTTQEDLGDQGIGWNDVAFVTNDIGFVVHGPAFCCGGHGPGELWETQDGGLTWSPV